MNTIENRLLILGVYGSEYRWVLDNLVDELEARDIEVLKQYHYPKLKRREAQAAIADEDMERKKVSWIRDVPSSVLELVVDVAGKPSTRLWTFSVTVKADFSTLREFMDEVQSLESGSMVILPPGRALPHDPPDMKYQPKTKNPNAPFSYDPNQDYYTEPDR